MVAGRTRLRAEAGRVTSHAPIPAAERQRRHRDRKRRGLLLARAEVPDRIVEALVDQGLLWEAQATDARAIGKALVDATEKCVTP